MDNYFQERDKKNLNALRELRKQLPAFCGGYFVAISSRTSALTRLGYARDLLMFFNYLCEDNRFGSDVPAAFTIDKLNEVTQTDIEFYLDYLADKEQRNELRAISRKLSAVRSLFKYLYNKDLISQNVSEKVLTPKLHEKEIIRLENDEMVKLLDEVEYGANLGEGHAVAYHKNVALRDTAIITLLLGTGIRISECVGLNIDDIDFDNAKFVVTRKGGSRTILYMPDEVVDALQRYLEERLTIPADTDAVFLSLQNKRINVRTVQIMVRKYARAAVPTKHITPHKLRSTFGTNLYRQTKDIYVVATVLGHSDVNTTKKHYAAMSEDIKKHAAESIHLRRDDDDN
jgi:site-specific recombinase XerD